MRIAIPQINMKMLTKQFMTITEKLLAMVPGGTKHYFGLKSWQRSCRTHAVKSRVRHAKIMARKGYRYKGGR